MSIPIRVGFVGLSATSGWASKALGPAMFSIKDKYHLVALSTSSESSASAAAEKYSEVVGHPVKSYSGSTDKISNDPDVDLVVVSVKAPHHYELLLPAIEAKKAVFIEWPAGCNLTQTVELAEKAAKHGIRSMVGLQAFQSPVVRKVCQSCCFDFSG
ncbi:MAG TPA: Gfo/Idh/MocA family oxidoreductase [Chlamydiales bacterium]|nr:Gfo/Idh/MocA family oxidoreductase [Chlamydiales bacterium]